MGCVSQLWTVSREQETRFAEGAVEKLRSAALRVLRPPATGKMAEGAVEKLRPAALRELRPLATIGTLEGGPLGDENREKRPAKRASKLDGALGAQGGGRTVWTGIGGSLGDEKRKERSTRRALKRDWAQGNKMGKATRAADPWGDVGTAGRSGCPERASHGFWASQAKNCCFLTPAGQQC